MEAGNQFPSINHSPGGNQLTTLYDRPRMSEKSSSPKNSHLKIQSHLKLVESNDYQLNFDFQQYKLLGEQNNIDSDSSYSRGLKIKGL